MSYSSHSPRGGRRCQPLPPRKVDRCSSHYWPATTQLHISLTPPSSLFHTRIDAWPQQWDNARAMTAWQGVSTPMQSAHCAMSYVLCIGLERTRWISNGYGYPSDLDMVTIFRPWIFSWMGWDCLHGYGYGFDIVQPDPNPTHCHPYQRQMVYLFVIN